MPINIQYQPDPQVYGRYAYGIGQGRRRDDERQRNDRLEQEAWRRRMQEIEIEQRQQQQEAIERQRQFENQRQTQNDAYTQYANERSFYEPSYAQEQQARQFRENMDFNQAWRVDQLDQRRDNDSMRIQQKIREQEVSNNGKWVYSPAQQQRIAQIEHELQAVRSDQSLEPWLKEDQLNRLHNEYDEIMNQPDHFEQNQAPSPEEKLRQSVVQHPDSGEWFIINSDNTGKQTITQMKPDSSAAKTEHADQKDQEKLIRTLKSQAYKQALEWAKNWEKQSDAPRDVEEGLFWNSETPRAPHPNEVLAKAREFYQQLGQFHGIESEQEQPAANNSGATGNGIDGTRPAGPSGQVDQGAQENQQAREQQIAFLHSMMMQAKSDGNDTNARIIAEQIKQLAGQQ